MLILHGLPLIFLFGRITSKPEVSRAYCQSLADRGGCRIAGATASMRVLKLSSRKRESRYPREPVLAPVFAAHAVVDEEQSIRIVPLLDAPQLGIIRSPILLLPRFVEEVTL